VATLGGGVTPEERLAELGITLPGAPPPAAAYVPVVEVAGLAFVSGQLPTGPEGLTATGTVGAGVTPDTAAACARQCAVNVLAQLKAALGDLSRVRRIVKLTVFVASDPSFTDQHLVANEASELFADVFGDAGRHARAAVGTVSLPLNAPVEVEAVVAVA
jgi:enamine deaminase RidA (YjgF/YER057c/UK114 family)